MSGAVIGSIDLIVAGLEEASDCIDQAARYSSRERVKGFSCYRFGAFDIMLSESALIGIGTLWGVILHIDEMWPNTCSWSPNDLVYTHRLVPSPRIGVPARQSIGRRRPAW